MSARNTIIFRVQNRRLLKFSKSCFWGSWIWVYFRFNSCFNYICYKVKTPLFFNLKLFCCLVKEDWSLKVALQFTIQGLVSYKLVAYKKMSVLLETEFLKVVDNLSFVHCHFLLSNSYAQLSFLDFLKMC